MCNRFTDKTKMQQCNSGYADTFNGVKLCRLSTYASAELANRFSVIRNCQLLATFSSTPKSSRGNSHSAISVVLRSATASLSLSLSLSPFGDRQMISFSERELDGIPLWRQTVFQKTIIVELLVILKKSWTQDEQLKIKCVGRIDMYPDYRLNFSGGTFGGSVKFMWNC